LVKPDTRQCEKGAPLRAPVHKAWWWLPPLVLFGVLLGAAGLWLLLDLDGDGASALQELRLGTEPAVGDTDRDGLADGWEAGHGLDPLAPDGDLDGLPDGLELWQGSDPHATDSDRDLLPDAQEPNGVDCDRDGLPGARDGDDDGDRRVDGLETAGERCRRDSDGDGVVDGAEGNPNCVLNRDCDGDGLADGQENGTAFDPLDPDSFDAGTPDSVAWAFQKSGQEPGKDADEDGIPDGWEPAGGLLAWGSLQPVPGEKDLLVEFLRVLGPDSGRFAYLDFTPAYQAVAATFLAEGGIHMRWVETQVALENETDPPLVPTATDPYYTEVLSKGHHSANPYVTTVVLNPQHDQSQVLHAGVAPIRGVLAAVDYGAHVTMHFRSSRGAALEVQPVLESVVRGGRMDLLHAAGFDSGGISNGRIQLHATGTGGAGGYILSWTTSWFRTPIRAAFDNGPTIQLNLTSASVDDAELAATLLHELGHTLGLCHSHDAACNAKFTPADRASQAASTMSYDAAPGTLHYLASEWTTVQTYLTCPPQQPLLALARHDGDAAVRAAKYAYANVNASEDVRACADLRPLLRQFEPGQPPARTFTLAADLAAPLRVGQSTTATALYEAGSATAAVVAGFGTWLAQWLRRRGRDGRGLHPPSGL
jgi:hypothetical protein